MDPYHEFKSFETEELPKEMVEAAMKVIKIIERNGGFFITAAIVGEDLVSNIMVKGVNPETVKQAIIQIGSQLDRYIPDEGSTKH